MLREPRGRGVRCAGQKRVDVQFLAPVVRRSRNSWGLRSDLWHRGSQISGVIRVALALRTGSAMVRFRSCLRQDIFSRLKILSGVAPPEAVEYRRKALRLFLSHGRAVEARRALLAVLPNGEWRSRNVQHYTTAGEVDRAMVGRRLADGVMWRWRRLRQANTTVRSGLGPTLRSTSSASSKYATAYSRVRLPDFAQRI